MTKGIGMPVNNAIVGDLAEITGWRRALHQMPELLYDVHDTAAFVAAKLTGFSK